MLRCTALRLILRLCVAPSIAIMAPLAVPIAGAQQSPAPLRDSAAAVSDARSAQSRFERDRILYLPPDRSGFSGGACDERVGRMCLWLEGRSDWWWPDREPSELMSARELLIEELAAAGRDAPRDPWVVGQQVVYLGEAGRWSEALGVARRCEAVDWWCAALEGLALHMIGDYTPAERAFARALDGMDPSESWRWREVRDLLDGPGRSAESRARERDDALAVARFWALSDPLFLVPGSDRYTEHMARRTWALTREEARNAYAMSWGSDLDELVIRYGWEVGWERNDPHATSIGARSSGVGHQDPRSQGFVAPAMAWDASPESAPEDWNPGSRREPRTGYAPAYAPTFLDLTTTVSRLPRGDSTVLVVPIPGLPADTTFHSGHDHPPAPVHTDPGSEQLHAVFAVAMDPGGDPPPSPLLDDVFPRRSARAAGLEGALRVTVPAGDHLVSVEVWDGPARTAARMRTGVHLPAAPPDVLTLSDLLPARPAGPLADSLELLLPQLVADPVWARGDTIRVGWEVHGIGWTPDEPLEYTLSLHQRAGGLLTRLGRAIGVVGDPRGLHLEWSEVGPGAPGPRFRVVDLVVPSDFETGEYLLTLWLRAPGREEVVSEREVRVAPDSRSNGDAS